MVIGSLSLRRILWISACERNRNKHTAEYRLFLSVKGIGIDSFCERNRNKHKTEYLLFHSVKGVGINTLRNISSCIVPGPFPLRVLKKRKNTRKEKFLKVRRLPDLGCAVPPVSVKINVLCCSWREGGGGG